MRTTVVHRRPHAGREDITMPCSRPLTTTSPRPVLRPLPMNGQLSAPWSTVKLGGVVSTLAALLAVVVDTITDVPPHVIVLAVMATAFAMSCHATARRPIRSR